MSFQSRSGAQRENARAPIVIDAIAETIGEEQVYAPPPPPRPGLKGRATAQARGLARLAERHAFAVATFSLALGMGWLIGAHSFAEPNSGLRQLGASLAATNARLDALAKSESDVAALRAQVVDLKTTLDATRRRGNETAALLKDRIEAAQRAPSAQIQSVAQRLAQMERRLDDAPQAAQTTSVARSDPAPRLSLTLPSPLPPSARAAIPPLGYVLRQASEKLAFIESRDGLRAIEPGQILPGAGKVHAIEKRGEKWIVVTSKGVIDSDLY